MELIEKILSEENLQKAIRKVKKNKGTPGVDKMTVQEVEEWFNQYKEDLISKILNKQYKPMPVKRVYIPKPNGKQRPLGIPTVVDRVIQQAMLQVLNEIYEPVFSEHSYGFRPNRSAHMAMEEVLSYLNEGYEWIVDLDIEKFFDTVNHDKLISILRERVNDSKTLHLIRAYLQAGILDKGLVSSSTIGTPQGGPISVILSNIYLDKFDKELESRNLRFARYADDCIIFVKSEMSANRVMKSVTSWLERKLFLKVSATKTKVVRPTKGQFLGFTFYKNSDEWKCCPTKDRKKRNNLNMELVQTDATLLKCMEFVDLPEFKLDQNICEDGSNLSGGQVQRIGIARTIAHLKEVLLCDEIAASLDAQTAIEIENRILDLKEETVLYVTHKYFDETLKKFDCILVFKQGRIVEQGSFEELMKNKEYFYSLKNKGRI